MRRRGTCFLLCLIILMTAGCSPPKPSPSPVETPRAKTQKVWLEELSSQEVGELLEKGHKRILIPTGGVEQNGPHLALGKHNFILQISCERLARAWGDTLVAPIIKYVPEGRISPPGGHMTHPGTLSVRPAAFRAILEDTVRSLQVHGFNEIVLLGDSGGNQEIMKQVAQQYDELWPDCKVTHLAEFYDYEGVREFLKTRGIQESEPVHHEELAFTAQVALAAPGAVRYKDRVENGKFVLNGVEFSSLEELQDLGNAIVTWRVERSLQVLR